MEDLLRDVARLIDTGVQVRDALDQVASAHQNSTSGLTKQWYTSPFGIKLRKQLGHGHNKLDNHDKELLLTLFCAFSRCNLGLRPMYVRQIVNHLFHVQVSPSWVTRFLVSHEDEICMTSCKELSGKRSNPGNMSDVEGFIESMEETISKVGPYPRHAVFNIDETRVVNSAGGATFVRIEERNREKHNLHTVRHASSATLVTVACADGTCLMSTWILKGKISAREQSSWDLLQEEDQELKKLLQPINVNSHIPQDVRTRSQRHSRYYAFNKTGCMNKVLWKSMMKAIVYEWRIKQHAGLRACLLCDQLGSHKDLEALTYAFLNDIDIWSLAPNTSHWFQPLDDIPFGNFKSVFREELSRREFASFLRGEKGKDVFFAAAFKAEQIAFQPSGIISAFRRTGLYPFSVETIQNRAVMNLGVEKSSTSLTAAEAVDAAASVVAKLASPATKEDVQIDTIQGNLTSNRVYSPHEAIAETQRVQDEKTAVAEAKRAAKEKATCRYESCTQTRRNGKLWYVCKHCNDFLLCPKHRNHRNGASTHESLCNITPCGTMATRSKKRRKAIVTKTPAKRCKVTVGSETPSAASNRADS